MRRAPFWVPFVDVVWREAAYETAYRWRWSAARVRCSDLTISSSLGSERAAPGAAKRLKSVARTTRWHLEVKDEPDRRAARATNWSG